MVTSGTTLTNDSAVSTFVSVVQTKAHAGIVYHSSRRHTYAGVTAPSNQYAGDNPGSGISIAGVGNNGTTISASKVYNHLNAATYNLTHIRMCRVTFRLNVNGSYVNQTTTAQALTVRPTSRRQSVSGVNNGGVSAGSLATATSYNNLCNNMFNRWNSLKNNQSNFTVSYCHSSCHTSCHSSRCRR
jgi:hypothetical protein